MTSMKAGSLSFTSLTVKIKCVVPLELMAKDQKLRFTLLMMAADSYLSSLVLWYDKIMGDYNYVKLPSSFIVNEIWSQNNNYSTLQNNLIRYS